MDESLFEQFVREADRILSERNTYRRLQNNYRRLLVEWCDLLADGAVNAGEDKVDILIERTKLALWGEE